MTGSTTITCPVSRSLAVADISRSVAFYHDVLGFEVRDHEAVSGPAQIELVLAHSPPSIVFFETNDVAAMRAGIVARGGEPSQIEKANWIKMKAFEIRDPDGHVLWFAQTFQEPDQPGDPSPQFSQALPILPLTDVPAGIAYYQKVLGFRINYAQADLGVMYRDRCTVLLAERSAKQTGIGSCEFYIRDADALHAELTAAGANVQGEPVSRAWGLRTFDVLDLEGNQLMFAQTFE